LHPDDVTLKSYAMAFLLHMQIYNECIHDLLAQGHGCRPHKPAALKLQEDKAGHITVQVPLCLAAYGHHLDTSWQSLQIIAVLSPVIM